MTRPPFIAPSVRPVARVPRRFRPSPMMALLANVLLVPAASAATPALPTGMKVVSGQATATQAGAQLTITNGANAILDWQSFSIGSGGAVRFVQPGASSAVLNRVTGNDPSSILGSLASNGRVWLLNPNGVLFGQGARVDVGSLVVSTLALADADWLAGNVHFTGGATAAAIDNRGTLTGSLGGRIVLVGGAVSNEGTVTAPGGQVLLAAGDSVDLVDTGAPNLSVHVQAPAGQVLNVGELSAAGGRIDVYAAAVNQQGIVRADSLDAGAGGTVTLSAAGPLTLAGGSRTSADSAAGDGGSVQLTGRLVALQDGSAVSASGATGGGVVLAGGGAQGQDAGVPNAQALFFARGASIAADAVASGNGGHVVLWSDSATRAYGTLSAHGGAYGGNGGLVETSGGWLDARPLSVDVGARHGAAGEWLLDPYDVTISDSVSDANFDASFTATGDATISSATLIGALNAGTNVTVQTGAPGNTGTSAGDITVSGANVTVTAAAPGSLTLIADHDISVSSSTISSSGGAMPVSLLSGRAGVGSVSVNNSTIATAGGDILLGGFGTFVDASGVTHTNGAVGEFNAFGTPSGVILTNGTTLDAGSGDIFVYGINSNANGISSTTYGIHVESATLSGHDITLDGAETSSDTGTLGIGIDSSTFTATHAIALQGIAAGDGVDVINASLAVQPAAVDATASLAITGSSSGADGVFVENTPVTAALGAVLTLTGTAPVAGSGIDLEGGDSSQRTLFDASTGGAATFTAIGAGGLFVEGVEIDGSAAGVSLVATGQDLHFDDAAISSLGPLRLTASTLSATDATTLASSASGDAIVAGAGTSGFTSLTLDADPFSAPNGRWIVWLANLSANSGSVLPDYDFLRFGVASAANWSADAGNGLVYGQSETVTVSGRVADKVYDGTLSAQASALVATPADSGTLQASVNSTASAQFGGKNAGTGKTVNLVDSADASPVTVTDTQGRPVFGTTLANTLTGTITPAPLSGSLAVAKVYDGTVTYSTAVTGLTGLVGSETVQVTASGAFSDKDAGTNLPVSASYQVADGSNGGLAANYAYSGPRSAQGTITPRPIDLAGLSVADKVYDATTVAAASGTPTVAPLAGDAVTVAGTAQAAFSDKNVGAGKAVTVGGLTLAGADAGDYTLVTSGLFTADITPRALDLAGLTIASKVYDATTAATSSGAPVVTPLAGDSVNVAGAAQAAFSDKNVGTGKAVAVSGLSLAGADAGNYTLVTSGLFTADITPRALDLAGLGIASKVYDATTVATTSGAPVVTPLAGDSVSVAGAASATFADKNVGTAKPVTVSGLSLAGTDAGNYTLVVPAPFTADITPRPIDLAGLTITSKVYDATATATASGTPSIAPLAGDSVGVSGTAQASFADKNVGADKAVSIGGLTLAGADAGNYTLVTRGLFGASITPASLTYVASPLTLTEGATIPALAGGVTGFVGGETAASATSGSLAFTSPVQGSADANRVGVAPGRYAIDGGGLTAVNYVFTQDAGNGQALTVVGAPQVAAPVAQQSVVATQMAVASQRPEVAPGRGVVIDATGLYPASSAGSIFGAQPLADMSSQAVAALVDARNDYKQALLSGALGQLSLQPGLADLPPCQSVPQAMAGSCLVTDVLRRQVQAAAAPDVAATAPAAVAAATVETPSAPPPPTPAATAAVAPPAKAAPLFTFRTVTTAALPRIQHKVAVLIGVDDYRDASIPHLTHAVGDAQAMAELFSRRLGYETLTLTSPDRATVVATLNRLALEMGPRDSVLVYYAGHGAVAEGEGAGKNEGYWLLADSQATRPEGWLSNADITRLLGAIDAGQVALISDSCYSGTLASGARVQVAPDLADPGRILERRTEVVMSSGGNEPVFDAGKHGHSPFAWNLIETLDKTSGWTPGDRVFQRVRFAVARELPQHPQYAGTRNNQSDADYLFEQRQLAGTN